MTINGSAPVCEAPPEAQALCNRKCDDCRWMTVPTIGAELKCVCGREAIDIGRPLRSWEDPQCYIDGDDDRYVEHVKAMTEINRMRSLEIYARSSPPVPRRHCPHCGGPYPCDDEDCIEMSRGE